MKETPIRSLPGIPYLIGVLVAALVAAWLFAQSIGPDKHVTSPALLIGSILLGLVALVSLERELKDTPRPPAYGEPPCI